LLGSDLLEMLETTKAKIIATDKSGSLTRADSHSLDVTDVDQVNKIVESSKPTWIINCAAYTAVDKAEDEPDLAQQVNGQAVANLASAALSVGAKLCQISTDYVFNGKEGDSPFKEEDLTQPCGVYGSSKFVGEKAVKEILPDDHLIIRTSWLHGLNGANFLATMLRLGKEVPELKIVSDQIGSPTYTPWLAEMIARLIESDARGTFHVSSTGNISWYDFAKEIFSQAGVDIKLSKQSTKDSGRPAPRPAFSTFSLGKLESFLNISCIDWKEGVSRHLRALEDGHV